MLSKKRKQIEVVFFSESEESLKENENDKGNVREKKQSSVQVSWYQGTEWAAVKSTIRDVCGIGLQETCVSFHFFLFLLLFFQSLCCWLSFVDCLSNRTSLQILVAG